MPVNTVSCLWIILLYLSSEFGGSDGKSYRNNKEKFINLAVFKDYVYIGAETSLIQLNSSLQLIDIQQDDFKIIIDGKNSQYKNWLLTAYNNETLIVCNYLDQSSRSQGSAFKTKCWKYIAGQISGLDMGQSITSDVKQPSARYLIAKVNDRDVLMIASSTCLKFDAGDKCLAISIYNINNGKFSEFRNSVKVNLPYEVSYEKNTKHVNFIASFKTDKYAYFLFNTEGRQSRLGKMCTHHPSFKSNSYEDTPIICSYNGQNYTVAQDVVHWKNYNGTDWIFVAFSGVSSSVICRYELTDVNAKFQDSRKQRLKCPYDKKNSYFKKQTISTWCYDEAKENCTKSDADPELCPEVTNGSDGFCDTKFFGSVEGFLPITTKDVIYTSIDQSSVKGAVVKLGVVPFHTHAIIHAGTSNGKIGQIFVTGTSQKVLEKFKTVQKSSPVLDIKVQNEDVYAMTQNMVIASNIKVII